MKLILPKIAPGPLIAHRGCSLQAPENSLAAYRLAAKYGFSWIETDAQLTQDGKAIMLHDHYVDRTTNGKGLVCEYLFKDLQKLDASAGIKGFSSTPIATLEQTIRLCLELDLGLILELKPISGTDIEIAEHIIPIIDALWPKDNDKLVVSSFSTVTLLSFKENAPWVSTAFATEYIVKNPEKYMEILGVDSFHFNYKYATKENIKRLKDAGAQTAVATVNDAALAKELLSWGLDGVMTDHSDLFNDLPTKNY